MGDTDNEHVKNVLVDQLPVQFEWLLDDAVWVRSYTKDRDMIRSPSQNRAEYSVSVVSTTYTIRGELPDSTEFDLEVTTYP